MKLFYSPPSPFARKVIVVLKETNQINDVELVNIKIGPLSSGQIIPPLNPLGKIPTLILPTGESLIDSKYICRYFAERQNGERAIKLYAKGKDVWRVLNFEALGDGIMDAAILLVYEERIRSEELRVQAWVDAQKLKITRTLDYLESNNQALTAAVNMGNLTIAIALDYLDFRHKNISWRTNHPILTSWHQEIKTRNSLVTTLPSD